LHDYISFLFSSEGLTKKCFSANFYQADKMGIN
jgi:hypothetical protein